jgi:hypothetical protein
MAACTGRFPMLDRSFAANNPNEITIGMNRRGFIKTGVLAGISANLLSALASGMAVSADPGVTTNEVVAYP